MAKDITSQLVIKINDRQIVNSFNGIRSEVIRLEKGLKKLTPGTEAFRKKAEELKEVREHFERVKKEIDAVNGKIKETDGFLGKLRSNLADWGIGIGQIFAGLGVAKLSQTADELLKISDAMADVQKTTGMTLDEVKNLWDAFDDMDTRTSKLDRLKIAEVGGRLGVAKEEIAEFVQEIDKAYVALGDSFDGGLEGVVESLGKIKNLFEETKTQSYTEAINGVGSALNELAANGTASEGNISDFTLRVGALPDALKPSIDKVLGLGAAFEESGLDSQIAASGYTNFMKVAGENLEAFAYSMNMSLEEARELFNTRPEEFFLRFSEGMKDIPADETAQIFDSLKLKSLEVQKAVGAAANNTDIFREAMERAGDAMSEATSLQDEFNIKNNNAAAIWQKLKNAFADIFTQTNIINSFEWLIKLMGGILGVTSETVDGVNALKDRLSLMWSVIKILTAGLIGYNVATTMTLALEGNLTKAKWLGIVADKAKIAHTALKTSATYLYAYAQAALTGNTTRAVAAQRVFNQVIKANPVGLFVSALITATAVIATFWKETDNATESQKQLNKIQEEAIKTAAKETAELDKLYKAATDASKGKDTQREAVEKLQRLYPSYFGNMDTELIMLGEAEQKYLDLKDAILASAKARAAENILVEAQEKSMREQIEIQKEIDKAKEESAKLRKNPNQKREVYDDTQFTGEGIYFGGRKTTNEQLAKENDAKIKALEKAKKSVENKHQKKIDTIQSFIDVNNKQAEQYEKDKEKNQGGSNVPQNAIIYSDKEKKNGTSKTNRPAKDTSDQEKRDAQSALRGSISDWERTQKSILDSERKFWDEMLQIMEDGRAKEELQEKENYRRRVQDAEKENEAIIQQNIELQEKIAELEQKKAKTKNPEAQKDYQIAIDNYKQVIAENQKLEEQNLAMISQMRETHQAKMQQIDEHYREKEFRLFVEQKEKEIQATLMAEEQKIQAISSLSEAKKALQNMEFLTLTETELQNIRTLEDAKKALREDAERKAMHLQLEAIKAQKTELEKLLLDPTLSKKAKAKLEKDLEELEPILTKIRGAIQGKKENDEAEKDKENRKRKESIDILGFSAQDWEDMFKNLDNTEGKIKGIIMATKALSNAFTQFAKLQQALGERELRRFTRNQDQKKKALLKQLNQGLITQEQYHKGVEQLEEQTDEKKRQIQRRAAKAEKAANLMSAISGTATAVVGALGNKPWTPANFALAGIVGALGAVQIATIAAQPLPEFAVGGYTGKGSGNADRTGFRPAGIVHENEYVTPKWMLENPVVADVVDWMESIRTGRTAMPKAFAEGGFSSMKNEELRIKNNNQMLENQSSEINERLSQTLGEVRDLLADLKENGVDTFMIEDAENGKRLKRTIKKFEKLEQKNARK